MAHFLFKIQYGGMLRRMNVNQKSSSSGPDLTFRDLESKIRDMFRIDSSQPLRITYTDSDNDAIVLCEDQDLLDACVIQGLSTLHLEVKAMDGDERPTQHTKLDGEAFLRNVLLNLIPQGMEQLLKAYEPLIKAAFPSAIVPETMKGLINSLTSIPPTAGGDVKECRAPSSDASKAASDQSHETSGCAFHSGVQCDVCGMTPIVGPRFRSTRKHDYNLCHCCYLDVGNEADYERIDHPLHTKRHRFHTSCGPSIGMVPSHPPTGASSFCPFFHRGHHDFQGCTKIPVMTNNAFEEQTVGKLDARFVRDVTIVDGSELPPGTHFTKIWCLRNTGSIPWPKETQFVFVSGDVLGSDSPVNLELSEEGLPPDEEIEASIDLVAPELPGQYVSHWRLMVPSGQAFGHRVWVWIQVVPKDEQSPQVQEPVLPVQQVGEDITEINGDKGKCDINVAFDSANLIDQVLETGVASHYELLTLGNTAAEELQSKQTDHIDDASSTVSSEVSGFSIVEKPPTMEKLPLETVSLSPRQMSPLIMDHVNALEQHKEENTEQISYEDKVFENVGLSIVEERHHQRLEELQMPSVREGLQAIFEETLLEQLELMGFSERALNLELLKKNKNNLQSTIEDLVAASEWEPILLELEEMGFGDKVQNVCLMFKNSGSVKRVVKELVQMQVLSGKAGATLAVKGKEKSL